MAVGDTHAKQPVEIQKVNILVVEGRDEELFFGALIHSLGLGSIQIMSFGGKAKLREYLKALIRTSGFASVSCLGIARDANSDPRAAFQSVCDALKDNNLPAPGKPLVLTGHSPRVTVMILPGEGNPGMLEDLCLRAVTQDPAKFCIDKYFECLQKQSLPLPHNMSKAMVHAFLASRPEADKRLGEAAQAGYWPWDSEAFGQVKAFLQQISS